MREKGGVGLGFLLGNGTEKEKEKENRTKKVVKKKKRRKKNTKNLGRYQPEPRSKITQ